jgi:hypothetical protein
MNRRRVEELSLLKQQTRIGIFGSFSEDHKRDLLALRKYLHDELGYCARISEDLTHLLPHSYPDKSSRDYALSELLIEESDIHILLFPFPTSSDCHHFTQSVTYEFALIKERKKPFVVLICEKGLRDDVPHSFGGVMKGSLTIDTPDFECEIIEYISLKDTYSELTMICYRFMRKIW